MKTVGETLQRMREKKGISIEALSKQTHIRPDYLRAIEANEFPLLPSPAAAQGFIGTYATIVGLEKQTALALLRRDFEVTTKHILPKELFTKPRKSGLSTRSRAGLFFGVALLVIVSYAAWSFLHLHQPPSLTLTYPKEGSQVPETVIVRGATATDAVLEIDTLPVALNQDGEFAQQLSLSSGDHVITVIASNRQNQETIKQINVHVE
ncbi:hypothetical protein C5B42_03460 [Candidatus Cerribacteria bacterium 'Amazon FNV 2010 28 9']|uniref:HTH cro/C1-type domain-containing protein n=1 Tax=Candidatus Cerribacteria bacterium 'Amazon FNV 2010 28 9' TaxID=2081795 RepID=A0A317JQ14_9BACT|nr:MAG: hypothetical protein C5B42_03460 [Candidatus Cerribacteria bacterium 'Amazon FNV 2010 28 9']